METTVTENAQKDTKMLLDLLKQWLETKYWEHVLDGVSNETLVNGHVGSYG